MVEWNRLHPPIQMDNEGIEALPLGIDIFLSRSFKLTDDSGIVGNKQIESIGINVDTGEVSGKVERLPI